MSVYRYVLHIYIMHKLCIYVYKYFYVVDIVVNFMSLFNNYINDLNIIKIFCLVTIVKIDV